MRLLFVMPKQMSKYSCTFVLSGPDPSNMHGNIFANAAQLHKEKKEKRKP